jgi:hypothetical protein
MEILTIQATSPFNGDQACLDADPDLFFPEDDDPKYLATVQAAKAVCMGCSIKFECLEYALSDSSLLGVWGGTDHNDRKRIRRRASRKVS